MIARLGSLTSRLARRFIPDPLTCALLLTGLSFVGGFFALGGAPAERIGILLRSWYRSLWDAAGLAFALQMCLILVTGHALALSPPMRKILRAAAGRFRTAEGAAATTAAISMALGLLHWGLGLVGGGLFAREVRASAARRGIAIDYPLVVACAYLSLMVWHGGLSGSAPLSVASPGHPLEREAGVIPLSETILSTSNLLLAGALLFAMPLLAAAMARGTPKEVSGPEPVETARREAGEGGIAGFLDRRPLVPMLFLGIAVGAVGFLPPEQRGLDFNTLNFAFLFLGLALHGSPRAYAAAVAEGARGVGGIVVQFPLYFGILGLFRESGMLPHLSEATEGAARGLANLGLPERAGFPLLVWLSASFVNLFVPSGGGQWAVQGPVVVAAARALGVPPARAVLGLAYGDEWTNMIQPFWALPLVGLTGVTVPRMLGYSLAFMLLSGPLFALASILQL